MAVYPSAVATDSDLYIAVNQKSTTLTDNPLAAGATTVNVNNASAFPSVGAVTIDAEIIHYTGKTATSFTGCTRGFDNTSDVVHTINTPVYHRIIADHHNVIKDEVKAIEQNIFDRLGSGHSIIPLDWGEVTPNAKLVWDIANSTLIGQTQATSGSDFAIGGAGRTYLYSNTGIDGLGEFDPYIELSPSGFLRVQNQSQGTPTDRFFEVSFLQGNTDNTHYTTVQLTKSPAASPPYLTFGYIGDGTANIHKAARISSPDGDLELSSSTNIKTLNNILHPNGSAGSPSVTFSSYTSTGLYAYTGGGLGLSVPTGGDIEARINSVQHLNLTTALCYIKPPILVSATGTASAPDYAFLGDTDTGVYRRVANCLNFATNGTMWCEINGTGQASFVGQLIGKGTATNDNASTGYIGEHISSSVADITMGATAAYFDITSITLSAGDWDISGIARFTRNAATYTDVDLRLGISTSSGTSFSDVLFGNNATRVRHETGTQLSWANDSSSIPSYRVSLSSSTTYYLKGYPGSYSAGSPAVSGRISARRVR